MEKFHWYTDRKDRRLACMLHYPATKPTSWVVFCHGFKSSKTGGDASPFVKLARSLIEVNIGSLRIDLPCNGESEGRFEDNRFEDWIDTIKLACQITRKEGAIRTGLVGGSMGGTCVMAVASSGVADCVVTWNADFKVRGITHPPGSKQVGDCWEEQGTRVHKEFWEQVLKLGNINNLKKINCPSLLLYSNDDSFTTKSDLESIKASIPSSVKIDILGPGGHGFHNFEVRQKVFQSTLEFLKQHLC